jgi:hypothetical protein
MDLFYPFQFGGNGWNRDEFLEKAGLFEGTVYHYQPFGRFRMSRSGFVQQEFFVIK